MKDLKIVRACAKDVENIYIMEKKNFYDNYSFDQIANDIIDESRVYIYLASINNNLVGYVYYSLVYDEVELLRVAINQDYRNQGIAEKLIRMTLSKIKGFKKVYLEVSNNNQPAIKLYHNLGFKNINIRERYYWDGSDAIIMCKDL